MHRMYKIDVVFNGQVTKTRWRTYLFISFKYGNIKFSNKC